MIFDVLCYIVLVFFTLPGLILEWIFGSPEPTEFTPEFPV